MAITKLMHIGISTGKDPGAHLQRALYYIVNPEKTEGGNLVGGNLCMASPNEAYKGMMHTKRLWEKEDGRQGYHFIISFPPTENITPEQAKDFGREFVNRYMPDFETLYAVHTDQAHLHIHFVFNSVAGNDGRKYHYENGDWKRYIQPMVNKMCAERGLTVLDISAPGFSVEMDQFEINNAMRKGKRLDKREWIEKKSGIRTWAEFAVADIDAVLPEATCFEDVVRALQKIGWQVKFRTKDGSDYLKHWAMRPPEDACEKENNHAWIRPDMKCGYGYSREGIEKRIELQIYDLDDYDMPSEDERRMPPRIVGVKDWPKDYKRPLTDYQKKYFAMLYRTGQMSRRKANKIPMEWRTEVREIYRTREMVEYIIGSGLESREDVIERMEQLKIKLMKAEKNGDTAMIREEKKMIEICQKLLDKKIRTVHKQQKKVMINIMQ